MWIPLLAALAGISCGGGNAASPGGNPTAQLTLNTSSIDFGNVAVGDSKPETVTLTNASSSGGDSITVSQIGISGSSFSYKAVPPAPVTLAPGQKATVTITFAPKSAGTFSGTLSVQIQGVNEPATVGLSGLGLAAGQLAVSPTTMDFGDVAVGSNQEQTGTLTAGASDITVSSADWNGEGFSVSGITFPVVVPASQSVPFKVTFTPQVAGSASGSISFVSDASNSPTNETLTGNGVQTSEHTVDLSWTASSSDVVGYNIYRGTKSGGPYNTKLNGPPVAGITYTDISVASGTTYYYVATAVDSNSRESVYSNETSAVIPNP